MTLSLDDDDVVLTPKTPTMPSTPKRSAQRSPLNDDILKLTPTKSKSPLKLPSLLDDPKVSKRKSSKGSKTPTRAEHKTKVERAASLDTMGLKDLLETGEISSRRSVERARSMGTHKVDNPRQRSKSPFCRVMNKLTSKRNSSRKEGDGNNSSSFSDIDTASLQSSSKSFDLPTSMESLNYPVSPHKSMQNHDQSDCKVTPRRRSSKKRTTNLSQSSPTVGNIDLSEKLSKELSQVFSHSSIQSVPSEVEKQGEKKEPVSILKASKFGASKTIPAPTVEKIKSKSSPGTKARTLKSVSKIEQ